MENKMYTSLCHAMPCHVPLARSQCPSMHKQTHIKEEQKGKGEDKTKQNSKINLPRWYLPVPFHPIPSYPIPALRASAACARSSFYPTHPIQFNPPPLPSFGLDVGVMWCGR
ncbi:hypothetical protein BS50DRAFT_294198 [Corynespora cassiicola Philippines]|uniref:Uncharacterized protein n=1 Tax=Corynespora cassiicola Philippines TaxID=1448308 RepID=A0A2T2NW76_CORCC|nr:hypothetical protein BS50DRAFT_294198 [Corynespora cassiicola Philippines]